MADGEDAGTGANNNFVTIPFTAVGYNTSDIQQIKITDPDDVTGGDLGYGTETFSVWSGVPSIVEGSNAFYWAPDNDPNWDGESTEFYWGDAGCAKINYSIAKGQAATINCMAGLKISVAGQVPTEAVEFDSINGNNFAGNPFPAQVDIQNIQITDPDDVTSGDLGYGTETFSVWQGIPSIVEGSNAFYWAPDNDPNWDGESTEFYWGDAGCQKITYPINPKQGVVINCMAGLHVKIDPPYSL